MSQKHRSKLHFPLANHKLLQSLYVLYSRVEPDIRYPDDPVLVQYSRTEILETQELPSLSLSQPQAALVSLYHK